MKDKKIKNKVNITEIAKEAGVSIASVSRVLNGQTGVSETIRFKINKLIKKYNYVAISHLSRERKIAILSGKSPFSNYLDELFAGIIEYNSKHSINTVMIFKNDSIKMTILEQIRDQQCGAVIVAPPVSIYDIDALAASELPVILIDSGIEKEGVGFIDHDAYSGSKEATNYLLKQGHTNIGYIEYGINALNHINRYQAYVDALTTAGIKIQQHWYKKTEPGKSILDETYNHMIELLNDAPELTAVMTTNDTMALATIKAITDFGKKVPDDISVIGFDNYEHTKFLIPPLTTVNHPIREMGYAAAKEIDLYWKNPQTKEVTQKTFPSNLIIRESTSTI